MRPFVLFLSTIVIVALTDASIKEVVKAGAKKSPSKRRLKLHKNRLTTPLPGFIKGDRDNKWSGRFAFPGYMYYTDADVDKTNPPENFGLFCVANESNYYALDGVLSKGRFRRYAPKGVEAGIWFDTQEISSYEYVQLRNRCLTVSDEYQYLQPHNGWYRLEVQMEPSRRTIMPGISSMDVYNLAAQSFTGRIGRMDSLVRNPNAPYELRKSNDAVWEKLVKMATRKSAYGVLGMVQKQKYRG